MPSIADFAAIRNIIDAIYTPPDTPLRRYQPFAFAASLPHAVTSLPRLMAASRCRAADGHAIAPDALRRRRCCRHAASHDATPMPCHAARLHTLPLHDTLAERCRRDAASD